MEKKPFDENRYKQEFDAENYDRVVVRLPKGTRDAWKAHAADRGESLNAFIKRAVDLCIADDLAGRNS